MHKIKLFLFILIFIFCQGNTFIIDPAKNAVWHNEKGLSFFELGDYYAAINEFRLAIMLNPESEASAAFYNNLGKVYYKVGDYAAAEKSFRRATEIKPYYIEYCKNLIKSYEQMGILNQMTKKYEKSIIKDINNLHSYLMLGLIHKEYGNNNVAAGYFRKFVKLAPYLRISEQINRIIKGLEKQNAS